jgi:hypothetical protein
MIAENAQPRQTSWGRSSSDRRKEKHPNVIKYMGVTWICSSPWSEKRRRDVTTIEEKKR